MLAFESSTVGVLLLVE